MSQSNSTSSVTFYRWSDMPLEQVTEHLSRRMVTGERVMLAQVKLKKGCIVRQHPHARADHHVLEGTLRFWIGEDESQTLDVSAGEVLHIPPHVPHKAEALEDTWSPIRSARLARIGSPAPTTTCGAEMDLGLKGRVALVAAASRGLGRAIAEAMAGEGARVGICARGGPALEQARKDIAARSGAEVHAVVADVSTREGIAQLAREMHERFGKVDILVGNAGGPPPGLFESHDWDTWQRAVDLTLRSAVELTRAVLPGMRERRWGRVIHVTSLTVKQPIDGLMLSSSIRSAGHRLRTHARERSRRRRRDREHPVAGIHEHRACGGAEPGHGRP
jgi:NADP-dependent 3-hydroxy acid dehydrogenase YdfG/quercetin dioxygenase-like cupin family protein